MEVFENRHRQDAYRKILELLDSGHTGMLSTAQKNDARIIIYGMSWGGSEAVTLARELKQEKIPVLLTIQVDSVGKLGQNDAVIPANVAEAVNFYQTDGLLHGRAEIRAEDTARTRILGNFQYDYKTKSLECEGYPWYDRVLTKYHTEIECDPAVWNRVETLIRAKLPRGRRESAKEAFGLAALITTGHMQVNVARYWPGRTSRAADWALPSDDEVLCAFARVIRFLSSVFRAEARCEASPVLVELDHRFASANRTRKNVVNAGQQEFVGERGVGAAAQNVAGAKADSGGFSIHRYIHPCDAAFIQRGRAGFIELLEELLELYLRSLPKPFSAAIESRDLRKRFQSASVPAISSGVPATTSASGVCEAACRANSFCALKRAVVK